MVEARHELEGGVRRTLPESVDANARYVSICCDGAHTTNLRLVHVTGGNAWSAYECDGKPLQPKHGGPPRLLVPHLCFSKSAKRVLGFEFLEHDKPGFWEAHGYHCYGDPWPEQHYQGE